MSPNGSRTADVWRALNYRQSATNFRRFTPSLFINIFVLALIAVRFYFCERTGVEYVFGTSPSLHSLGLSVEFFAAVACVSNILFSFCALIKFYFGSPKCIDLTPAQKKLLGITDEDSFFSTPPCSPTKPKSPEHQLSFSLCELSWLFNVTPKKRQSTSAASDIYSPTQSPYSTSDYSYPYDGAPSPYRVRFSLDPNSEFVQQQHRGLDYDEASFNETRSRIRRSVRSSPCSDDIGQQKNFMAHFQQHYSPKNQLFSDISSSAFIDQSVTSFNAYFPSNTSIASKSFDTSALSAFKYHPSRTLRIDSSPSVGGIQKSGVTSSENLIGDSSFQENSVWARYDLNTYHLEERVQNLRLWLSETILRPVVREIDNLNSKAVGCGTATRPDFRIGESALGNLQSIIGTKSDTYPTLIALLPYLQATPDQEYLVKRLRELVERDSCLTNFQWDKGGKNSGKFFWDNRSATITDSELVAHMFCAYMDSKLRLNPLCPEGKSFSARFFLRYPTKLTMKKGKFFVYQNSLAPAPTYQFITDEEIFDFGKGKNTLFYAMILFFQHVKLRANARLDTISLGPTGLNVLWILD